VEWIDVDSDLPYGTTRSRAFARGEVT